MRDPVPVEREHTPLSVATCPDGRRGDLLDVVSGAAFCNGICRAREAKIFANFTRSCDSRAIIFAAL